MIKTLIQKNTRTELSGNFDVAKISTLVHHSNVGGNSVLLTSFFWIASLCLLAITTLFFLPIKVSAGSISLPPNNLGLVGYWSFEDATGTKATDFSGNGNVGTLTNGPTWVAGKIGKALDFDATNDNVLVSDSDLLDFGTTDFSVSAWIKRGSGIDTRTIVTKRDGSFYGWIFYQGDGRIGLQSAENGGSAYAEYTDVIINTNEWYHVVGVGDRTNGYKIYVNGVLKSTSRSGAISNQDASISNAANLYIGQDNSDRYFDGMIDDVRVYNRIITATEVTNLYNRSSKIQKVKSGASSHGLVAYWSFEDGVGTSATDFSGNGNTGTLTNMNSTTSWVNGRIGKALDFYDDIANNTLGGDYVTVADNNSLDFGTSDFSVSFWHKSSGTGERPIIMKYGDWDQWSSPNNDKGFYIQQTSAGKLTAGILVSNWGKYLYSLANVVINDDTWRFITVNFNRSSNTIDLYINGSEVSYTTDSSAVGGFSSSDNITNTHPLQIGVNIVTDEDYHHGQLDEIRIYNRALSTTEITNLYSGSNNTKRTKVNSSQNNKLTNGLVGLWSFDGKDVSISAGAASYTVINAGSTEFNGTYTDNGQTSGGYSIYEMVGNYFLFYDTVYSAWVLQATDSISGGCPGYWLQFEIEPTRPFWDTACTGIVPLPEVSGGGGGSTAIAYDRSGNNNHGTLTNGPTPVAGKIGQGMSFDGTNDYVSLPDITAPVGSVSFWLKSSWTPDGTYQTVWSNGDSDASPVTYIALGDGTGTVTGEILWVAGDTGVVSEWSAYGTGQLGTLQTNSWHHIVVVRDTSSAKVYFDGVELTSRLAQAANGPFENSNSTNYPLFTGTGTVHNLGLNVTGTSPLNGALDDFRVYNRALSTSEIQMLYNMGR